MDLALDDLQWLICHKPKQTNKQFFLIFLVIHSSYEHLDKYLFLSNHTVIISCKNVSSFKCSVCHVSVVFLL